MGVYFDQDNKIVSQSINNFDNAAYLSKNSTIEASYSIYDKEQNAVFTNIRIERSINKIKGSTIPTISYLIVNISLHNDLPSILKYRHK